MTDNELIARLRSGIAPHEYSYERGCTILQLAANRIEELQNALTQELIKNLPPPPDARWRFEPQKTDLEALANAINERWNCDCRWGSGDPDDWYTSVFWDHKYITCYSKEERGGESREDTENAAWIIWCLNRLREVEGRPISLYDCSGPQYRVGHTVSGKILGTGKTRAEAATNALAAALGIEEKT